VHFLLFVGLLVQIGILLVIKQTRQQFLPHLGSYAVNLVAIGFVFLVISQTLQLIAYFNSETLGAWADVILVTQILGYLVFFVALIFAFKSSVKAASEFHQYQKRETWLKKVNESIPVAIFVKRQGEVIYSNQIYKNLQKTFKTKEPFAEMDPDKTQQEVWLHTENGDGFGYWVNQYSIEESNTTAYIVTDITSIKLQGSFIQKIAQELNSQHKNNIDEMTKLIHGFISSATLYIGVYDRDTQMYQYLSHQGVPDLSKSPIQISNDLLAENEWRWINVHEASMKTIPNIVKQAKSTNFGGMFVKDSHENPLGVILLILPDSLKPETISELLLDFLAIFSLRVKSELEHQRDKLLLKQSSQQYRAIIESSNEAIVDLIIQPSIYTDESVDMQWKALKANSKIAEVNPVFLDIFEFPESPTTHGFFSLKSIKHMLRYVLESGFSNEPIEVAHQKLNGEIAWLSCTAMADISDRRIRRIWLIIRDITDSKTHIQHLEYQARHDKLTGLPNRIALHDYLDEKIDQVNQFGFKLALVLFDLNRFKEINDALGHHYGDVLLKKIEPRIRSLVSEKRGFLARLGGDEFALVLPSIQNEEEIKAVANQLMAKIREPFDLGQLNVEVGCSIGLAYFPEHGAEASTLVRCADIAMYQAKKETVGTLSYRPEMDENSPRRLALMVDMNKGIKNDEFFLVYQPKIDLSTNKIGSAEALIRWRHPELGLINPGEFIPLAEMSDAIIHMTHWVIDQALQQIKTWQEQGIDIKVSVNVSTRNLLDEDLTEFIKAKIHQYQVAPHLLEVEITESALMADPDKALSTISKISKMGVSISIDDFGTGYSSFIYLRQLPIDTLKIDIMFVRNMCTNKQDEIIVNSIVNLAHNLSLTVVAEGAETHSTVERLRAMGCNYVQGFFISKPVLPDEFISIQQTWGQ